MHRRCVRWGVAHVSVSSPCHWRGRHRSAAQVWRAIDRALLQSLAWRLVAGGRRRPGAVSGCTPGGKGGQEGGHNIPLVPRPPPWPPVGSGIARSPWSSLARHLTLAGAPASVSLLAIPAQAANAWRGPGAPEAPRTAREALDAGARSWHVSASSCTTIQPPRCSRTNLKLTSMPISIRRRQAPSSREFREELRALVWHDSCSYRLAN
jgi:hypothetical protein